jgi:hypothetical protein
MKTAYFKRNKRFFLFLSWIFAWISDSRLPLGRKRTPQPFGCGVAAFWGAFIFR